MASANTVEVTENNFEAEIKQSDIPVLIDFWAAWCGPCKMLSPILEEIADENVGKVKVAKVDTDANPTIRDSFGINGIPTLVLMKNGEEVTRLVGFMPKKDLISKLGPHVALNGN